MQTFRITLKNYRCFPDGSPLSLEIGPGFTALLGANNSGKSSFLRFFYEFRTLFQTITSAPHTLAPREFSHGLNAVGDWEELFHNANDRDIVITIENLSPLHMHISKVTWTCMRKAGHQFKFRTFSHRNGVNVEVEGYFQANIFLQGGNQVSLETSVFASIPQTLAQAVYVGPFRNAINEGAGNYFDLPIGTSFIAQWNEWKNGLSRTHNHAVQRITNDIAHIFEFKQLEINASSDQKTLQIVLNGQVYRLPELGAGLAQFIIVFGNLATRKPALLLIDEPELNLHPSLQADFLTSLASYAVHGVLFATHSVGLARTVSDRIYTFRKQGSAAVAKTFEQTPNFAEFVGELSFSTFKELGHETILLVEGVTEVKAVQQFLRLLRKDHQIVVVPLGGSQLIRGGVEKELAELNRLSKKVAVMIDSERKNAGETLAKDREAFVAACSSLNFKIHLTERRAFENYLTDAAVKATKGSNYRALGPYELLREVSPSWAKSDNWRIVRAMVLEDFKDTDIGKFMQEL